MEWALPPVRQNATLLDTSTEVGFVFAPTHPIRKTSTQFDTFRGTRRSWLRFSRPPVQQNSTPLDASTEVGFVIAPPIQQKLFDTIRHFSPDPNDPGFVFFAREFDTILAMASFLRLHPIPEIPRLNLTRNQPHTPNKLPASSPPKPK
jgi:hypothetical protein